MLLTNRNTLPVISVTAKVMEPKTSNFYTTWMDRDGYGKVMVGPGGIVDGEKVEMTVCAGDRVITGKYTGTEVKLDGEELTIVKQNDILAVVE